MSRPNVNVVVGGPISNPPCTYKTKILRPNLPFSAQVTEENTKYVIKWDFDLGGETVTIPENCILEFDGGSIDNGTLIGQDTVFINVGDVDIWGSRFTREGTWKAISSGEGGIPDKEYDPDNHSGLGRKTLQLKNGNNILTQEDFDKENTIYVIGYDFDLNGAEITIPSNSILQFEGGNINNGTIIGNDTIINGDLVKIFGETLTISGTLKGNALYVEWFGAKGDGETDDTECIRKAIYTANKRVIPLVFQNYKKYIITDTLNYYNDSYFNIDAILQGNEYRQYPSDECGILLTNKSAAVFRNAEINGVMKGLRFVCITDSHTTDGTSFFRNCTTRRFTFENCYVSAFNVFSLGTNFYFITRIQYNRIKAFFFTKNFEEDGVIYYSRIVDSFIDNNYITGTPDAASNYENVDNVCFAGPTYNGSYIRNNFIEYYKSIFDPGENNGWGNINSLGNHYQVFRYFYRNFEKGTRPVVYLSLTSLGDAFNWNNPDSTEAIIGRYANFTDTYIGQDGNTYDVPPYIVCVADYTQVCIRDCVLENNLGNIVFIKSAIKDKRTKIEFTCNETSRFLISSDSVVPVSRLEGAEDSRAYDINTVPTSMWLELDTHTIPTVDELIEPKWGTRTIDGTSVTGTFSKYLLGEKVRLSTNNRIYTLQRLQRDNIHTYEWVQDSLLHKELTTITYNKIDAEGTINVNYSFCYAAYGTGVVDDETVVYNTISTINVLDSLLYIPLVIYNYDTKDVVITALKYNNKDVVLKPYQICVFVAYPSVPSNSFKVIDVSEPRTKIHVGTFSQAQALVTQGIIGQSDIGYEFFATDKGSLKYGSTIYYTGNSVMPWVYSDGTPLVVYKEDEYSVLNPNCATIVYNRYSQTNDYLYGSNGLVDFGWDYDGDTHDIGTSNYYLIADKVCNRAALIIDFEHSVDHTIRFKQIGRYADGQNPSVAFISMDIFDPANSPVSDCRPAIRDFVSSKYYYYEERQAIFPKNTIPNGEWVDILIPANIKSLGIIMSRIETITVQYDDGNIRYKTHDNSSKEVVAITEGRPAASNTWIGREIYDATLKTNIVANKVDTTANAVVWKDTDGFSPVKYKRDSTGNRPIGAITSFEGSMPDTKDNLHDAFTYKNSSDDKWYIFKGEGAGGLEWEDEATNHPNVPVDAPRKGTTAQRPTAEYIYNNLYVGFNYYDTDLDMPIYVKNVTRSGEEGSYTYSVEWDIRKYYSNNLLTPNDIGFEYFDTTIGMPIYVKEINNYTGDITWSDASGTIV